TAHRGIPPAHCFVSRKLWRSASRSISAQTWRSKGVWSIRSRLSILWNLERASPDVQGPPAVDAAVLQGVQGLLAEGVVGAAALPDKVLGGLPGGGTVGGAAALDD